MYDLQTLVLFAGTLALIAGTPGPSVAALIARVLSGGARSVLPFLAAMWVGEAIWLTCAVLGLAVLAQSFQTAFALLKWAGIAYLAFLAWKMWTAPVGEEDDLPRARSPWRLFAAGLAVTLGNPKIMIFYFALLPSILDLSAVSFGGWLELTLVMVATLIVMDLFWVFAAHKARAFLRTPLARRRANRLSAGLMAGAATAMAVK